MSDNKKPDNVLHFPRIWRIEPDARLTDLMIGRYILVDRKPVLCRDLMTWAREYENRHKSVMETNVDPWRVALTDIGDYHVSTVFLGLDHAFFGGPAMLFETMIFRNSGKPGEEQFDYQDRCSTWEEAEAMHERAVQYVRENGLRAGNGDD